MVSMTTSIARNFAPSGIDPKRPGRKIRHAREDMGESIEDLAVVLDRAFDDWMVTPQVMKNVESGRTRLDAWRIPVLAEHQGKPVAYYVYDDPYTANTASSSGAVTPRYVKPAIATVTNLTEYRANKQVG